MDPVFQFWRFPRVCVYVCVRERKRLLRFHPPGIRMQKKTYCLNDQSTCYARPNSSPLPLAIWPTENLSSTNKALLV